MAAFFGLAAIVCAVAAVLLIAIRFVRGMKEGYGPDAPTLRETRQAQIRRGRKVAMDEGLAWVDEDGTLHNFGKEGK
jgi:hypothetical protein